MGPSCEAADRFWGMFEPLSLGERVDCSAFPLGFSPLARFGPMVSGELPDLDFCHFGVPGIGAMA